LAGRFPRPDSRGIGRAGSFSEPGRGVGGAGGRLTGSTREYPAELVEEALRHVPQVKG